MDAYLHFYISSFYLVLTGRAFELSVGAAWCTWLYLKKKNKKCSTGMLKKRKNAFGLNMISCMLMEMRNGAPGQV